MNFPSVTTFIRVAGVNGVATCIGVGSSALATVVVGVASFDLGAPIVGVAKIIDATTFIAITGSPVTNPNGGVNRVL